MFHVQAPDTPGARAAVAVAPVPRDRQGVFAALFEGLRSDARQQRLSSPQATRTVDTPDPLASRKRDVAENAARGTPPASRADRMKDSAETDSAQPDAEIRDGAAGRAEQTPQPEPAREELSSEVQTLEPRKVHPESQAEAEPREPSRDALPIVVSEAAPAESLQPALPVGVPMHHPAAPLAPTGMSEAAPQGAQATGVNIPQIALTAVLPGGTQTGDAADGKPEAGARVQSPATEAGLKANPDAPAFQHLLDAAGRRMRAADLRPTGMTAPPGTPLQVKEGHSIAELARVLRTNAAPGQSSMVLQLDPPELGQLRINVLMRDQALTVRFEAQNQAGHDAIQSRLSELKTALEQHGISVRQFDVELRPPPVPQQQQDGTNRDGSGAPGQQWGGSNSPAGGEGRHGGFTSGANAHEPAFAGAGETAAAEVARAWASGVDLMA